MSTTQRRVLVTGAAGRLGSTVAARFHAEGFDLVATDVVDPTEVPYRFERADLLDHTAASALLDGIDVLLHIGNHPGLGNRPPQQVFNENVSINENMFQGAAECGVGTIVFASTLQLIGSHVDDRTVVNPPSRPAFPLSGDTPPTPSNSYALSKTVSETMLHYFAEQCGIRCTALRFPLLHHSEDRYRVESGHESQIDIFEGFTGLTYDDAAELFLAVVRSELPGYNVFAIGTAHRHRDRPLPDLIREYYPEVDPNAPDLIDLRAVTEATGWQPGSTYRSQDPTKRTGRPGG